MTRVSLGKTLREIALEMAERCSNKDQHIGFNGREQRLLRPGIQGVISYLSRDWSRKDPTRVEYICEKCGQMYLSEKSPEFLREEEILRDHVGGPLNSFYVTS